MQTQKQYNLFKDELYFRKNPIVFNVQVLFREHNETTIFNAYVVYPPSELYFT